MKRLLVLGSVLVCLLGAGGMFGAGTVAAATRENCEGPGAIPFLPKWYKYLPHDFVGGECNVSVSIPDSLPAILLAVFEILLTIVGVLSVIFIIYGGFQYLTSAGEPDKAKAGRTTIINALVGLMIAMLATAIVNLVGRNLG